MKRIPFPTIYGVQLMHASEDPEHHAVDMLRRDCAFVREGREHPLVAFICVRWGKTPNSKHDYLPTYDRWKAFGIGLQFPDKTNDLGIMKDADTYTRELFSNNVARFSLWYTMQHPDGPRGYETYEKVSLLDFLKKLQDRLL